MGRGKGKTLTPQELRKKLAGPKKEGSAKNTRKAVTSGQGRAGRRRADRGHGSAAPAPEVAAGEAADARVPQREQAGDRQHPPRPEEAGQSHAVCVPQAGRTEWNARKSLGFTEARLLACGG
ncbi:hypothetical protein DIPPA_35065 [Diplonema papillatum]|nr:hypothetical protein DIPPA_35065 [Diplonema papillatum]